MAARKSDVDDLVEVFADPVKFARGILGHDTWGTTDEILTAVAKHDLVVVKACHASAKSFTAAEAALWWVLQGREHICINTAPTWGQVERVLWGEIKKATRGSAYPFPVALQTKLVLGPKNYIEGISTDQGVRLQGLHGDILIIVDEAVGVAQDIFEAIEGIRAGGRVHLLLLGNPTVPGGYFYNAFQSPSYKKFTIDAYDTPNLLGIPGNNAAEREAYLLAMPPTEGDLTASELLFLEEAPRPYLVLRKWVWEKLHNWGADSPAYQARVRGRFPDQDAYALYPMDKVEAARLRDTPQGLPLEAGVDVAGPGDNETCCYVRAGDRVLRWQAWRLADVRQSLAEFLLPYKPLGIVVKIDVGGIGYHVATYLKGLGFNVRFVNAANLPTPGRMAGEDLDNKDRFRNLKAQHHWGFRQRLVQGSVSGLTDELTCTQLQALKWREINGKIDIESKGEARSRGVKSPDRAEALVLAFAEDRTGRFVVY